MDKNASLFGLLDAIFEDKRSAATTQMQVVARVGESRLFLIVTPDPRDICACLFNFMSVLARYIPWFIKDLGVSIIGDVSALHILAIPSGVKI